MVKDRNFYKTIFRISLPAAFSSLVSFLVVVADDIMVSYIGSGVSAQSAVSQINALTAFFTATVSGLVSGSSVLIAQYWGKKDMERIKRIFGKHHIHRNLPSALSLITTSSKRLFISSARAASILSR